MNPIKIRIKLKKAAIRPLRKRNLVQIQKRAWIVRNHNLTWTSLKIKSRLLQIQIRNRIRLSHHQLLTSHKTQSNHHHLQISLKTKSNHHNLQTSLKTKPSHHQSQTSLKTKPSHHQSSTSPKTKSNLHHLKTKPNHHKPNKNQIPYNKARSQMK